jgi:hypothetical protein
MLHQTTRWQAPSCRSQILVISYLNDLEYIDLLLGVSHVRLSRVLHWSGWQSKQLFFEERSGHQRSTKLLKFSSVHFRPSVKEIADVARRRGENFPPQGIGNKSSMFVLSM